MLWRDDPPRMMLDKENVHGSTECAGRRLQGQPESQPLVRGKLKRNGKFFRESIRARQIESVQLASEEAVLSLGGAAAFGTAGALLLGPVGLLAGLMLGGRGKETTFICKLTDGRKFMATARTRVFKELEKVVLARAF
jgi:hypothetical protein